MGRLFAAALVVVAAGIGVVIANGPGKDKPKEAAKNVPRNESTRVLQSLTGGTTGSVKQAALPGVTINMSDLRFHPSVVHVRVGQAVRWANHDNVEHTVYQDIGARSGEEPLFASDRIGIGRTFTWVAQSPGTIHFVCTLHPATMKGVIVVSGNAS